MRRHPLVRRTRGAALLAAMLTVTLVASFAAMALWQQWRTVEIEAAERARVQSAWVLVGALDWSRLILMEDGRSGGPDHLAEPWAVPLAEAKLTSFLAADKNIASDALEGLPDAYLSGRIVDAQSKLNLTNLVEAGKRVPAQVEIFSRLFDLLGLPAGELALLVASLERASQGVVTTEQGTVQTGSPGAGSGANDEGQVPLLPQHLAQLVWLGVSPQTVAALEPYVTILPLRTPLNINTASAEALYASKPGLDLASAQRLVAIRARSYFRSLEDANRQLPTGGGQFAEGGGHTVSTRYFEVRGRLRLAQTWVEERSLVRRESATEVKVIWRERGAGATPILDKP